MYRQIHRQEVFVPFYIAGTLVVAVVVVLVAWKWGAAPQPPLHQGPVWDVEDELDGALMVIQEEILVCLEMLHTAIQSPLIFTFEK